MSYVTLTPLPGKDYKSKAKAIEAYNNGSDFTLNAFGNPFDGKPCNRADCEAAGYSVHIRYNNLRKVTEVT